MGETDRPKLEIIAEQLRKPSGEFADTIAQMMDKANEFLFDLTADALQPKNGENILEIGFGSGKFTSRLFSDTPDIKLYGIDYSPEMVSMATANNQDLVNSGKLELVVGNSDSMQYKDNAFDKVFCNMVVFFWDNPTEHLREIRRVLQPGGKFYTGIRSGASMRQFPFTGIGFNLYEPDEWKAVLEQNGFDYVTTEQRLDPPLNLDNEDQTLNLESVCIIARNNEA